MSEKRFPANIITPTPADPAGSFEDSAAPGVWSMQEAFEYVKAGLWPTAGNQKPLIEDVFSTYLYTGNGSTQTITNGIDLAGEGGLVWVKWRSGSATPGSNTDNILVDTERGTSVYLESNSSNANISATALSSFNSDGFTTGGTLTDVDNSGDKYASWTWRKAPRWFDVVTWTGDGTSGRTISHNLSIAPGFIVAKATSTGDFWRCYHRSLGATKAIFLDLTNAENTSVNHWNDTEPTDSVFTLGDNVNVSGRTYVAYLFAHDPLGPSGDGSDGLIACGSFTTNADGSLDLVDLGWEPQWLLIKNTSTTGNWEIHDVMRDGTLSTRLRANLSDAEVSYASQYIKAEATGFSAIAGWGGVSLTKAYIAIRRGPMRAPTSGTEVFAQDNKDGDTLFDSGWPVDMALQINNVNVGGTVNLLSARLQGNYYLRTESTTDEAANTMGWDNNLGMTTSGTDAYDWCWMFRRAPGFFDVVAYTGDGVSTGRTVSHNLGVAPELMIIKWRDGVQNWYAYSAPVGNEKTLFLNLTSAVSATSIGYWYNTTPTSTVFTLGAGPNGSGRNYIAYLFATLPGVSKVGSYTGNGTSQTIDCGFTTGARFILIKRTDSTGDWYFWDSARGIVAGNDPHLSLNTTAAEVTTDDSVDAESTGFIVNQDAATNVNVSSAEYIFLAIA